MWCGARVRTTPESPTNLDGAGWGLWGVMNELYNVRYARSLWGINLDSLTAVRVLIDRFQLVVYILIVFGSASPALRHRPVSPLVGNSASPFDFRSIGTPTTHDSHQGYVVGFCERPGRGNDLCPGAWLRIPIRSKGKQ